MNRLAIAFVILVVITLDLPYTPAGLPWNDDFDASVVNYTPFAILLSSARRGLVARHREGPATRARSATLERRTRVDAGTDGSAGCSCPRRAQEGGRRRQRRHGAPHHRRHGGPPPGQAPDGLPLPRRGGRARGGGLQLPARRGRGHGHRVRLRDVRLAPRLRRLRDEARPRHAAGDPVARGHRPAAWPTSSGRTARTWWRPRARSSAASSTGSSSADGRRRRAPSSSSSSSTTPTRRPGARATATSSRRTSTTSTTRCSAPRAWSRSSAGSGTRCRAPGCGSRTRRASATSASTRSTSATTTRSRPRTTHALYKTGAKEIAAQEGYAITFIAKLDEREGNSCHIHCSLQQADGQRQRVRGATRPRSTASWPASSPACASSPCSSRPQVNSYKRFVEGSFAPTAVAWGHDNRTCSCAWSGTARACGWRTACPGPT